MDERAAKTGAFLLPGIEPDDVPRLRALLDARVLLDTFIGVFRGSVNDVIVRILVLSTLAGRGEAPRWTPADLDSALGFIEPSSLETARLRLSKFGLIVFDSADGTYAIGDYAFIVLSAWSASIQFADERFGELGFMNAQIVGGAETLGVPEDLFRFALARTNTLHHELERAIITGSTAAIREARDKIGDAFKWGEQSVSILEKIAPDPDIGIERRVAAQQLADAQSRMLTMAPRLDGTLHALDAQRVRLGDSGVDTADVKAWLRLSTHDSLVDLVELTGVPTANPGFILQDVAVDVAEEIILSERVEDVPLPDAVDPVEAELPELNFDRERLERLFVILDGVMAPLPLAELVENREFDEASYYLSLVSLLGSRGEVSQHDPAAKLADYKLELTIEDGLTDVPSGEVAKVSTGHIRPKS